MTVLRDQENALLVEANEPLSFKEAIVNLFEKPSLASTITEGAFQEAQYFTWDSRAERVLQFAREKLQEVDESATSPRKNLSKYIKRGLIKPYIPGKYQN